MGSPYGSYDALNTSTAIVNGQLVPQVRTQHYVPLAIGPVIQGVPASPPQSSSGTGGYNMSDNSSDAAANPWNPVKSPVPWLIGMFIVGYILLRHVHWGY